MKKISVIFFLLCFISIFIFNRFKSENIDVLYVGDNKEYYQYISSINEFNLNKYTYNTSSYKKIIDDIKSNSLKIVKEKNVYLTQMLSESDVIILSSNNFEYKNKCKKIDRIISEYDLILNEDINSLISILNKISKAKIIVLGNSCNNKNHIQELNLLDGYYISVENIDDLSKIINKIVNN